MFVQSCMYVCLDTENSNFSMMMLMIVVNDIYVYLKMCISSFFFSSTDIDIDYIELNRGLVMATTTITMIITK